MVFNYLCLLLFYNPEHYFEAFIGFLDPENIGLAYLIKFLGWLEAEIAQNMYFMAAILKVQNGGHAGVYANANIDFRILHALMIPKMYRFANLPKFWTKLYLLT